MSLRHAVTLFHCCLNEHEGEDEVVLVARRKSWIQKRVNEEDEEDLHERRCTQTLKLCSQMKIQANPKTF